MADKNIVIEGQVKKEVFVEKKTQDYICPMCNQLVEVNKATQLNVETDKVILHTWDYGHQHRRVYRIYNKVLYPMDD